jgi:predicted RNase H-like HicB family nuclease
VEKMLKYPARFKNSKAGDLDCFYLEFIDFPDAFTQGLNLKELEENGRDVLSLTLESMVEDNEKIPPPSGIQGKDIIYIEPYTNFPK